MPSRTKEEEDDIELDEAPTSIDPYAVLSLSKDATQDEVKTAYRKAALKNHPDKAASEDKSEAHSKFQEIAFAYAILSDERRRRRYDTTGRTEESLLDDDDFDWHTFFQEQFKDVVTFEAIDKFSEQYKGSDEERRDLLKAYERSEGNMDNVYTLVMLSDPLQDDDRFRGIIDAAIKNGEVEDYAKYSGETEKSKNARITRALKQQRNEEKEVSTKERKSKKGASKKDSETGNLAALIQSRQKDRQAEDFFDRLESKYAPNSKKAGSKRAMDEPPEEAFAKNAKKGKK